MNKKIEELDGAKQEVAKIIHLVWIGSAPNDEVKEAIALSLARAPEGYKINLWVDRENLLVQEFKKISRGDPITVGDKNIVIKGDKDICLEMREKLWKECQTSNNGDASRIEVIKEYAQKYAQGQVEGIVKQLHLTRDQAEKEISELGQKIGEDFGIEDTTKLQIRDIKDLFNLPEKEYPEFPLAVRKDLEKQYYMSISLRNNPPAGSDILRIIAVHDEGGFYQDVDISPRLQGEMDIEHPEYFPEGYNSSSALDLAVDEHVHNALIRSTPSAELKLAVAEHVRNTLKPSDEKLECQKKFYSLIDSHVKGLLDLDNISFHLNPIKSATKKVDDKTEALVEKINKIREDSKDLGKIIQGWLDEEKRIKKKDQPKIEEKTKEVTGINQGIKQGYEGTLTDLDSGFSQGTEHNKFKEFHDRKKLLEKLTSDFNGVINDLVKLNVHIQEESNNLSKLYGEANDGLNNINNFVQQIGEYAAFEKWKHKFNVQNNAVDGGYVEKCQKAYGMVESMQIGNIPLLRQQKGGRASNSIIVGKEGSPILGKIATAISKKCSETLKAEGENEEEKQQKQKELKGFIDGRESNSENVTLRTTGPTIVSTTISGLIPQEVEDKKNYYLLPIKFASSASAGEQKSSTREEHDHAVQQRKDQNLALKTPKDQSLPLIIERPVVKAPPFTR